MMSGGGALKCMACDLWLGTYDLWVSHLTSEGHQGQVSSLRRGNLFSHEHWREESIRDRCLIVSGVKSLPISALVRYLSRFGLILDIIRQQERISTLPDYYFIQYESVESVMKIMTAQYRAPHQIQGHQIFFRRKYDRAAIPPNPIQAPRYGNPHHSDSVVRLSSTPKLHKNNMYPDALGKVASQYRDESESALALLQQTYGGGGAPELDDSQMEEEPEEHDLFSQKMTEHLAKQLFHLKLEDQLEGFCKNILLSEPFLQARFGLIQELQGLFKNRYPKCAIYPCGPDYIGIGNSDDAVNVLVDLFDNQMGGIKEQPWEQSSDHHISEILQILKLEQDNFRFCTKITKNPKLALLMDLSTSTMSPLSFVHLKSRVKCNVRTQNFRLVQESMLIKFLCTLDLRIRPLLALVRYWSSFNGIFEGQDEDMRNRLPIFLMIFHLANRKIIPSLSHLQSLEHEEIVWNNMDISFCGDLKKVPQNSMKILQDKSISTLSILSMLKDFFQRFGVANLKDNAICLWPAKFIQKCQLDPRKEDALSEDLAKKMRIGANGDIIMKTMSYGTPICVQDIFDLNLNMTSEVGEEEVKHFQMSCWKTSEKLEEILNQTAVTENNGRPHLMDIFIDSSSNLIKKSPSTELTANSIDVSTNSSSIEIIQDRIPVDPSKQAAMNIEWEEFSKSLEQPSRPLSFLSKPVAPIAPSPKITKVPNPLFFQPPQQPHAQSQMSARPEEGSSWTQHRGLVSKPPLRYQSPMIGIREQSNAGNLSWESYEEDSKSSSDDDDEDDDDSADEDGDPVVPVFSGSLMTSTLQKPLPMSKVKLSNANKNFFIRAVSKSEFSYGGRGKMQSLWLQFLKHFNSTFWRSCFGFEMTLEPPYQDVTVEAYANFNKDSGRGGRLLTAALDAVPNFEESYSLTFYCQSQRTMNRVLCARKNDLINSKYIRRQVQPLLSILMGEKSSNPRGHLEPVSSEEEVSFKCNLIVTLDYQDLRTDCFPSAQLVFERGSSGLGHLNQLVFLGKLFERMAPQFISRCFQCWLGSCVDFDLQSALKSDGVEREEERRRLNLERKGKPSKRKLGKMMKKAQVRAEAKAKLLCGGGRVVGGVGGLIHRELGHGGPQGPPQSQGTGGRGKKNFQVPSGWNRTLDLEQSFRGRDKRY